MRHSFLPLFLVAAALMLPAGRAHAATPSLAYSRAAGYQITVTGAGWNPAATVTVSVLKGSVVQSIDLRPAADGTFAVGMNKVNICGLTMYAARDTAGESAALHGAGVMCMQNYVPPRPGTAMLVVVRGQTTAPPPGPSLAPRPLLARYFADLNAHHDAQALALESDCAVSFMPGAQSGGAIQLHSAAPYRSSSLSRVRAARVAAVSRFHLPALDAATLVGFHVRGTFQFSPSLRGLSSGARLFTVLLRQCGGRWTVDPGWISPTPYSWL